MACLLCKVNKIKEVLTRDYYLFKIQAVFPRQLVYICQTFGPLLNIEFISLSLEQYICTNAVLDLFIAIHVGNGDTSQNTDQHRNVN